MWELDYIESWVPKNWYFWTVVLEKTLESPWTARRSNLSVLKKINPQYSLEGLMLKFQYFGHHRLIEKDPDPGKDRRQEYKGTTEDEMVEWHHWLNADEFEHEFLSSRSKVIIPFKCSHSFSHLLPVLLAKNSQLNYSPVAASDKEIWLT